ncbi:hypothetical protein KI387_008196, partial [Taxus chinensis]
GTSGPRGREGREKVKQPRAKEAISSGSEEFVLRSTGTFGKNGCKGREPAGLAETGNVSTRTSGTNGCGGCERVGRPADQPDHDMCHKEKGPK